MELKDLCDKISKNELPVFFFDTCVILNIINSLHLNTLPDGYAKSARDLIKLQSNKAWLITCQTIHEEWNDTADGVIKTMQKELVKIDRNIKVSIDVTNIVLNANYKFPQRISDLKISKHVKSLSENFLTSCLIAKRDDNHSIKAMRRVRKNQAPARKGKSEAKDCEIIECFFDVCKRLRNVGFNEKIVFVTANKADFGTQYRIKPPLDTEFEKTQASMVSTLNHCLAITMGKA